MSDYEFDFEDEDAEVSKQIKSNEKPHNLRGSVLVE